VELGADDFCFVTANSQMARILGQEDLVGRHASAIFGGTVAKIMLERLREGHAAGRATTVEYPYQLRDSERWFVATLSPMPEGASGKPRLSIATLDITDRKRAEAELKQINETLEQRVIEAVAEREQARDALRQSQKMESLGQLVGGIAHDFNNLLTGIIGSLDLLERRVSIGRTENLERYTTTALASAKRAAALTQRLLAFSRRQALDPKPVDVNVLVKSVEDLVRRSVGEQIIVEAVLSGGLWATKVDRNELEHALINLCVNARDAMPDGGRITIETSNGHLDAAYAARQPDVKAGQYVVLSVTDTGTGMTPDILERVFEPFFTTKPIGQGTGLGLSQLHGFVKQSGGHVAVYSEVGQGTSVKIYLPRHHGAVIEEPVEAAPELARAEAQETVLVVEDEDTVRMLVLDVLDELGYAAHEAIDAVNALRILESDTRVDLLITDVGLPGMNGRQLADRARELRSGLKTLFITGYAHNAAVGNGLLEPGMEVLTKPFAVDHLASRIREMVSK
jgi:PAS domain S-box-containing protein